MKTFGRGSDRAVMETSDDAAVSKLAAVSKGYYRVRCACGVCAVHGRASLRKQMMLRLADHCNRVLSVSAVQDDYIKYFVKRPANRAPLINRGHYSRVASVRYECSRAFVRLLVVCSVSS
jgi:hypothetical protein